MASNIARYLLTNLLNSTDLLKFFCVLNLKQKRYFAAVFTSFQGDKFELTDQLSELFEG